MIKPKIRFDNNYPEWAVVKVEDIIDYERPDKYIVKSDDYCGFGVPVLTANKSFILGFTDENEGVYEGTSAIIFDDFTCDSKYVDFPFKVKSSAIKILSSKDDNKTSLKFFYECLNSKAYKPKGHQRHWIGIVQKQELAIPCYQEQQKIAAFFTALDEKIKIYSQKIDYLHNLKKGVVKKLFSEISSGEEFILGDLVGRISSGKTKNVKDNIGKYPLCGSTGVIGCCRHHEYSGEKILIARVGANAGTVNFHYGDCGVTDNTLVISSCKSTVSLKWLFHFLTFKNLTKMVFGSGQPLITASQLKNISVPVPSIECQIVVVNTLDTMDKAVEIASKKLDCLQSFKKAFMQQMFV